MTPDYKITSAKYEEGFIKMLISRTDEAYASCRLARTNKVTNQVRVHWQDYAPQPWLLPIAGVGTVYNVAISKMQDILAYLNSMDTENAYSFIQ
jgi:hypothetical protein